MRRRVGVAVGIVALLLLGLALWGSGVTGPGDGPPDAPGAPGDAAAHARRGPAAGSAGDAPEGPAGATTAAGGDGAEDTDVELTDAQLAARAAELAVAPETHVICDLGLPIRSAEAYLAIGGHSDGNGRRVEIIDGKAYLPLVYDLGTLGDAVFEERSGVFSVEGYGPVPIAWGDRPAGGGKGRCTGKIQPEVGRASLTGTLTLAGSGAPAAGGWVEGCGNMAFADDQGIVHMDIVATPCKVLAMRQDGALRTVSEPVDVVPVPGHDVVLDITLPAAPKAGLGVKIGVTDAGLEIQGVIDGGPAQAAGLAAGDVVVQVDGQPAADMTIQEFVALAAGAAGTPIVLGIDRDGQRLELTLVRAPIPG